MATLFLNTFKQDSQCCLWHGRGRAAQLGSRSAVPPCAGSPGTGSAPTDPWGELAILCLKVAPCFPSREALPRGRRTSRCHRRASHSAARPWTAWGCCGSGRRWTGTWPGSFSRSRALGWSSPWHTCVVWGEAVSEPPWLQWDIPWSDIWWKHLSCCGPGFHLLPYTPTTSFAVILRAGLRCSPRSHQHLPLGDQRPVDLVEILWGGSRPAVVENNFKPGEIQTPD